MDPHPPQPKGWFGRNWKWFIPTGCLGIILIVAAGIGAVVYVAIGAIKSSDIYQESLTKVRSSAAVVERLGEPVEAGWQISGNINVNGNSGNADVKIPISGPKKSGALYVTAVRRQGRWDFSVLEVEIEGDARRINLLTPSPE